MTTLLEEVLADVAKLSPADQDAVAVWLKHELEQEERWQRSFDQSLDVLDEMASEAVTEFEAGLTEPFEP